MVRRFTLLLVLTVFHACGDGGENLAPLNEDILFRTRPEAGQLVDFDRDLTLCLEQTPETINPLFTRNAVENRLAGLLFESLFLAGPRLEFKPNPIMVESMTFAADRLSCTVVLRKGLTWHDGKPFTASDVAFSFALLRDEKIPHARLTQGLKRVAGLDLIDPLCWRMRFTEVSPVNCWELLFPVLPHHLWQTVRKADPTLRRSGAGRQLEENMIGNGPYRLATFRPAEEVVLKRWDGYPGPRPAFKQLRFQVITDRGAANLAFQAGELDLLTMPHPADFKAARMGALKRPARLAKGDSWTYQFLVWNLSGSNPFFIDPKVRRALAYSLNRKNECDRLGFSLCHGPFHPDSPAASRETKPSQFDLPRAAQLLTEAGWKKNKDGWRQRRVWYSNKGKQRHWKLVGDDHDKNEMVTFAFTIMLPSGSAATRDLCLRWRNVLAPLGIKLNIADTERSTMMRRVFDHQFEATFFAWAPGVDPYTTRDIFGSTGWPNGKNLGGYRDDRVDELYQQGLEVEPGASRLTCYQQIDRLIQQDQPYLFLWYLPRSAAFNPDLRGIGFGPSGLFGYHPGLRDWWFPARKEE